MESLGIGNFVAVDEESAPEYFTRVSNDAFPQLEGIAEATGIESRLLLKHGKTVSAVARHNLRLVLKDASLSKEELGGVIFASCTRENKDEIAKSLLTDKTAQDASTSVDCACTGFIEAVRVAIDRVQERQMPFAVIATEPLSTMINYEKPTKEMLQDDSRARSKAAKIFGDGSGGALVWPSNKSFLAEYKMLDVWTDTVPTEEEMIVLQNLQNTVDYEGAVRENGTWCINMPGKAGAVLKKQGSRIMIDAIGTSIEHALQNRKIRQYRLPDHIVTHQPNGSMLKLINEHFQRQMKEADDTKSHPESITVWNIIKDTGNVSAACIPAVMQRADSDINFGDVVGISAVGAGREFNPTELTYGAMLLKRSSAIVR